MFTPIYVLAAMVALIGSVEQGHVDQLVKASAQLKRGDNEARVLAVLGPPLARWPKRGPGAALIFGDAPPKWSYGTLLDVSMIIQSDAAIPNVLPRKLRLFGPETNDLVIIWDNQGVVDTIECPHASLPVQHSPPLQ